MAIAYQVHWRPRNGTGYDWEITQYAKRPEALDAAQAAAPKAHKRRVFVKVNRGSGWYLLAIVSPAGVRPFKVRIPKRKPPCLAP